MTQPSDGSAFVTDASGHLVTDANGDPVLVPKNGITDPHGMPVTDAAGNPRTFATDADGNMYTGEFISGLKHFLLKKRLVFP